MKKIKQFFALAAVIIILGLVFLTLYCAFTGSPYFMASLISMLLFPILLYSYLFIYRLLKGEDKEDKKPAEGEKQKNHKEKMEYNSK